MNILRCRVARPHCLKLSADSFVEATEFGRDFNVVHCNWNNLAVFIFAGKLLLFPCPEQHVAATT